MKQTTLDLNGPILGFSTHPQNVTVNNAGIATFIGIATAYFTSQNPTNIFSSNTGVVTHRWYAAGIGALSDGTNTTLGATLSGTATTTLTLSNVTSPTTNGIQLFVSADYVPSAYQSSSPITAGTGRSTGNAINEPLNSSIGTLTVLPLIKIITQPTDKQAIRNTNTTFTIDASLSDSFFGTGISYQWQLDGQNINDGVVTTTTTFIRNTTVSGTKTPTLTIKSDTVGIQTVRCSITNTTASNSPVLSSVVNFSAISDAEQYKINVESIGITNSATLSSINLFGSDYVLATTGSSVPALGNSYEGGFLICKASPLRWVVSPYSTEVSRTWDNRNDANTRAQEVSGCTGWFVPTKGQLQNPGYCCRSFWGPSPCYSSPFYWSSTEYQVMDAYAVNFITGTTSRVNTVTPLCVRAFRCVTY